MAARFVDRLATTLDWLTENAESDSLKSFPNPVLDGVRTWWVDGFRSYVIAYRIVLDTVEVVGVLHAHRDLPAILRFRM